MVRFDAVEAVSIQLAPDFLVLGAHYPRIAVQVAFEHV